MVTPFNLSTGEYAGTYEGISAREAVIAAHAQKQGDYNTWDYEARYGSLVVEFTTPGGAQVVRCGNFTTGAHNNGRWPE